MLNRFRFLATFIARRCMATHEITLGAGLIRGTERKTIYGHTYYSFEGVPYAKPPINNLRFRAPQPVEPWDDVLDCTDFHTKPVQYNPATNCVEGSEDCLYVNVYSKNLQSQKPLPVMVWFYGGGFYMGGCGRDIRGPDYLMMANIVLVTVNYRLCSLGFLSLCDPDVGVPGNAGLKDQVLALQWIKENIKHFNGDAENITVFGESAGGACAHYMTLIPRARGLFHKAICMSGNVLNEWALLDKKDYAFRLAKYNGYRGADNDKEIIYFLRGLDAARLVGHQLLTENEKRSGIMFPFGPTVEPYIYPAECVIPRPPIELLKDAWGNEIPMIFGGTSFEGLVLYPQILKHPALLAEVQNDPLRLLPRDYLNGPVSAVFNELKRAHFGTQPQNIDAITNLLDFFSYRYFWLGIYRSILSRLRFAQAPTYLYRFDFDSPTFNFHRIKFCGNHITSGVSHGDDVDYLFHNPQAEKLQTNSAEFKTIQRMVAIWTAFAQHTDPNCSEIINALWKPVEDSKPLVGLNIGENVDIRELPEREKLDIWINVGAKKTDMDLNNNIEQSKI